MKIAVLFLVTLTVAFSQSEEKPEPNWDEYNSCKEKCSEVDKKEKWVCYGDGIEGYFTRCEFNCSNKAFHGSKLKEAECKPGGQPYCEDFECKEEEKIEIKGKWWCEKIDQQEVTEGRQFLSTGSQEQRQGDGHNSIMQSPTICGIKCDDGNYTNDATYYPCPF